MNNNIDDLIILNEKLSIIETLKKHNRLDFMEWYRYKAQYLALTEILTRCATKIGVNIYAVFGSNRSGKSELGGGIIGECFRRFRNRRIWGLTYSDLSIKVQQRKCASLIRKSDIAYGDYNEVRGWANRTIISKKDTVMYFKTYEQGAGASQGDDIDLAWFDEEPPYSIFKEVLIRLADRNGICVLTFTSLQGFTELVNNLWGGNNPDVKKYVLLAKDNPFLSNQSKLQLYNSIDKDELESRWYGNPNIKTGLIYKEFKQEIHVIDDFDYIYEMKHNSQNYIISEGIDPHERTPHRWIRFFYDIEKDYLYIVDELIAPKESMLIDDFSRIIKIKRENVIPEYTQIDTSSEKPNVIRVHKDEEQPDVYTVRMDFQKNGIETVLCQKDNAIGINEVKTRLKTVRTILGVIKRKPKIYVFRSCTGVIDEFQRYCWDTHKSEMTAEKKEIINKPLKKNDHFMDLIKYECLKRKTKPEIEVYQTIPDFYDKMGY